jgi:broad specificity phosphatase PhoE
LVSGIRRRRVVADRVIAGSLRRQRDTAKPCAASFRLDVELDERWNEYNDRDILAHHADVPAGLERQQGDEPLDAREFQEILDRTLLQWVQSGTSSPCHESWPQFLDRVTTAVTDLARELEKGQVAFVISSGGAIAAVTGALLGLPPAALIPFNRVSLNTGITKLTVGRGGLTVISVNEHAHLEEAGGDLITYR